SEINGFFASDLMIDKVRDLIAQLTDLEDTNKANAVQTQLKTLREEAVRQLRDQQDLFVDGENIIRFGKHNFSVNVQPLDLTIVQREGDLYFHLTGTDFYEQIVDKSLLETQNVWQQSLVSEDKNVYRAEYLAYLAFQANIGKNAYGEASTDVTELLPLIQKFAATRYEEGYTKGVHDADAAQLLAALYSLEQGIDLLHFSADVRAAAQLFWEKLLAMETRTELATELKSAGEILQVFPESGNADWLVDKTMETLKDLSA
ncbi:MAG: AAA family ATPase, partial [Saprospiraceae bacterium]